MDIGGKVSYNFNELEILGRKINIDIRGGWVSNFFILKLETKKVPLYNSAFFRLQFDIM